MKGLGRYWGYLAFILLLSGLFTRSMGPAALILLSGAVTFYFLLLAPLWCAAINRDGTLCRNNSSGLLLGCRYRQHKFQKLKMRFVPQGWARMNRDLWTSPRQGLATLGLLVGIFSGIAGVVLK